MILRHPEVQILAAYGITKCPACDGTGLEPPDPREDPTDPGITMTHCKVCKGAGKLPMTYDDPLRMIEFAGRTCYQSFDKAWDECPECNGLGGITSAGTTTLPCKNCNGGDFANSAEKFTDMLDRRGHHAMLEHSWLVTLVKNGGMGKSTLRFVQNPSPFLYHDQELGDSHLAGNWRAFRDYFGPDMRHDSAQTLPEPQCNPRLYAMTARIICDRGVTHEIVRHRPASYAQESTRYCNYKGGVEFIIPPWVMEDVAPGEYSKETPEIEKTVKPFRDTLAGVWLTSCHVAEKAYLGMLEYGWLPQQARAVLPNSLKTEIVVTASLFEWQHIFKLRCAKAAHPQMREVMTPLRAQARKLYPGVFE